MYGKNLKLEEIFELLAGPEAAARVITHIGAEEMKALNRKLNDFLKDALDDDRDWGGFGPRGG